MLSRQRRSPKRSPNHPKSRLRYLLHHSGLRQRNSTRRLLRERPPRHSRRLSHLERRIKEQMHRRHSLPRLPWPLSQLRLLLRHLYRLSHQQLSRHLVLPAQYRPSSQLRSSPTHPDLVSRFWDKHSRSRNLNSPRHPRTRASHSPGKLSRAPPPRTRLRSTVPSRLEPRHPSLSHHRHNRLANHPLSSLPSVGLLYLLHSRQTLRRLQVDHSAVTLHRASVLRSRLRLVAISPHSAKPRECDLVTLCKFIRLAFLS